MSPSERLRALARRLLSYRTAHWRLDDYPLRRVDQSTLPAWIASQDRGADDLDWPRWCVEIIGWPAMTGMGDTPDEAYEDLARRFEVYRDEHLALPRPGVSVPVEVAASARIEANLTIVDRIVVGALGMPAEDVFLSDESRLSDFALGDDFDMAELQGRIGRMFDVDVSHIEDGNIAAIAEFIAANSPRL